jgi:flagellar motor switch protein FliN
MTNQITNDGAIDFAAAFASALAETVMTETGSPWQLAVLNGPDPAANQGTPIHFRLTAEGAVAGECFVEVYEPKVAELASKITKQTITVLSDEHIDAVAAVLASASNRLAGSLQEQYGKVVFRVERAAGLAFGGMYIVPLATSPSAASAEVSLYFGGQLLEALTGGEKQGKQELSDSTISTNNLKLVMDLELNVLLRFGQRQLPLRDVLELGSGSVIELDRMVDDPVELYLDGKLIARGEAVVVDGNYGLRVTEIPQPVAAHLLN